VYDVVYYYRPNGRSPAREWVESLDNSVTDCVDARLEYLEKKGLLLLNTEMMEWIPAKRGGARIHGFYELRHEGKKWRMGVYHDLGENKFILLDGWRKSQPKQQANIEKAIDLLQEYLSTKGD